MVNIASSPSTPAALVPRSFVTYDMNIEIFLVMIERVTVADTIDSKPCCRLNEFY